MSEPKRYWQRVEDWHKPSVAPEQEEGELPEDLIEENTSTELGTSRRDFLKLMGLTFSAGVASAACSMPVQKAIPFLNKPEELTPGVANWYASTCGGCSAACGILVKQRDGRPIKIEGNPDHPLSQGGLCAVGQATVLSLYDGKRLRGPYADGKPSHWETVDAAIKAKLAAIKEKNEPIVILSSTITGPSILALIQEFIAAYPSARHVVYDPISSFAIREAYRQLSGQAILPSFHFDKADMIVGLDADFLGTWLSPVEFTKAYSKNRKLGNSAKLSTHVQIESGMTVTGANADLRIPVDASARGSVALWLYDHVVAKTNAGPRLRSPLPESPVPDSLAKVADALIAHRGRALVVSGSNDVAEQLVVAQLNHVLGSDGRTISLDRPSLAKQGSDAAMATLVDDLNRKRVAALIVMDNANPVYEYPLGKRIAEAMPTIPLIISLAGTMDETATLAHYVCPSHYFLEAWGDANPRVGVYSLMQPVIAPLFDTRAAEESLLRFMHRSESAYDYIRTHWQTHLFPKQSSPSFTAFWDKVLQQGSFTIGESVNAATASVSAAALERAAAALVGTAEASTKAANFDIALYPSVAIQDGRFAGNPWLMELPDPITRVSWSNYVAIAPQTADGLGLTHGDIVTVTRGDVSITLPVFIQPGQAPRTLSIALGYGRTCGDKIYGENAYPFAQVHGDRLLFETSGASLAPTGERYVFATVQTHHSMEGRPIVLETTLDEYQKDPHSGQPTHPELLSLWERHDKTGHFWGMSIDLNACTGCSACVVACQAENNIPVVGETEIRRKRDMHWLRIDRYYSGSPEAPMTVFQPMLCQHCENAPCETVCPVLATVHSSEGLSQQIYNRCVGTRYCANNCPYKVRRFNWFNFTKDGILDDPLAHMVLNPDVTVRTRGVMEKCSMCAQRIMAGKTQAAVEKRALKDGEFTTACAQSCPADAIVFGDMNDSASRVSHLKKTPRNYRVLEELGTRPVVSYLTKVRNTLG